MAKVLENLGVQNGPGRGGEPGGKGGPPNGRKGEM